MQQRDAKTGMAALCLGGGNAVAVARGGALAMAEPDSRRSASSAPARWATASPRSSPRTARTVALVDVDAGRARRRAWPRSRSSLGALRQEGEDHARPTPTRSSARIAARRPGWPTPTAPSSCVEAVVEDADVKAQGLRRARRGCCPAGRDPRHEHLVDLDHASSRAATKRADRVIGMHFMNPVPLMKLVEVIRGLETSRRDLRARSMACARGARQDRRSRPTTTPASSPTAS